MTITNELITNQASLCQVLWVCAGPHLGDVCAVHTKQYVGLDGVCKHQGLLSHQCHRLVEVHVVNLGQRHAIKQHAALLGVVKTLDKLHRCRSRHSGVVGSRGVNTCQSCATVTLPVEALQLVLVLVLVTVVLRYALAAWHTCNQQQTIHPNSCWT